MDLSAGALFAGMIVSTVGLGLFLYGKREARAPQLISGLALMGLPMFVQGAAAMSAAGGLLLAALWVWLKRGT